MTLVTTITKKEAKKIGNFTDKSGVKFTPFCQETSKGKYIVTKDSYAKYKDRAEFKKISWILKTFSDIEKITFKKPSFIK